jgi:hypothetical protein
LRLNAATGAVLVFPESQAKQVKRQDYSSMPAKVQAKIVVFASPFHGEGQAGAPVSTGGAACHASSISAPASATSINGSPDHPINRPTAFNRSTPHAFRCFRPSAEAEVLLRDHLPVFVDSLEVLGPVRARAGPWRVCGEWWAEGWNYEEWDVEVSGRLYRICCELPAGKWFVTGGYD